jgi:rhodanese-related sulfurtransferase
MPARAGVPIQEARLGAVEVGVEARFPVIIPVSAAKQGEVVIDIKTDCDCLRLLTPLPIEISGTALPLEFAYTGRDNGRIDVAAVLQSAGGGELAPFYEIRFSGVVYSKDWLADAAEVAANAGASLLVDIRENASLRSKAGIPGSVVMGGFALRAQATSFGGRPIVLVGDNLSDASALLLAADLKAGNPAMKVRVLRGGIAMWKRAGGKINGPDASAALMVLPGEVVSSSVSDHWVPVIISGSHAGITGRDGVHIAGMEALAASKDEIHGQLRSIPKETPLLVITEKGQHHAEMEKMLPADILQRVLYVEGGLAGIERAMTLHNAAAQSPAVASLRSSGQGVTRAGSCGGCGKK